MRQRFTYCALVIVSVFPAATLAEQTAAPLPAGDAGIAWYSRWDTALAEAERSTRPILFQSASAQCSGVPGVF